MQGTLAHELAHNLGMHHASSDWDDDNVLDAEYGEVSDTCGGGGWAGTNAPHRIQMGWLKPDAVKVVPSSGIIAPCPGSGVFQGDPGDYRGNASTTLGGATCQSWGEQSPVSHSYQPWKHPRHLADAALVAAWGRGCHTRADQADYRGAVSTTASGHTCLPWTERTKADGRTGYWTGSTDEEDGTGDHNHCRNPDGHTKAWCYTTTVRWEDCDVGEPLTAGASCGGHNHCRDPVGDGFVWCYTTASARTAR